MVKKVLREAILWVILLLCIVYIIIFAIPHLLFSIFSDDKTLILQGMMPLRIMAILLPFRGFFIIGRSFFQAIGKARQALIINMSYLVFLIPLFYILPIFMGITGVFTAWPIAVVSSAAFSGVFLFWEISILNRGIKQKIAG